MRRADAKLRSDLLKCFVTKELMRWPGIESLYGPTLRQSPTFATDSLLGKKTGIKAEGKTAEEIERPGESRWEQLHKRVVEHVSGYLSFLGVFFSLSFFLGSSSRRNMTCANMSTLEPPGHRAILHPNPPGAPNGTSRLTSNHYRANNLQARY